MEVVAIANGQQITGITLAAAPYGDGESDVILLSNPLDKPLPVSFYNPDNIPLTFNGADFGSLQITPKTIAKLIVTVGGDIIVESVKGGEITAIEAVPPVVISSGVFNFSIDNSLGITSYRKMISMYNTEFAKVKAL